MKIYAIFAAHDRTLPDIEVLLPTRDQREARMMALRIKRNYPGYTLSHNDVVMPDGQRY